MSRAARGRRARGGTGSAGATGAGAWCGLARPILSPGARLVCGPWSLSPCRRRRDRPLRVRGGPPLRVGGRARPADGSLDWAVGDAETPGAAALVQQADPGAGDAPARASTCRRSCWRWPARRTPARPFHVDGARRILAGGGLDESALQTPADYPLDDQAREELIRAGGERAPRSLMNCSGKHAAMLATCVVNGWDIATYRDPGHPLQKAIAETFAELTGEAVRGRSPSTAAARRCCPPRWPGWRAPSGPSPWREDRPGAPGRGRDPAAPRVRLRHPRDERALLRAIPGAIGKAGAESCYAVALAGRAGVRAEDRRRCRAGPPGADGRGARAPGRARGAGRRRRRGAAYRRARAARWWPAGGIDPRVLLGTLVGGALNRPRLTSPPAVT